MNIIFGILAIIAAILLILIVDVQNNMIGTRRATQDIEKYTWYLLGGLIFLTFLANVTNSAKTVQASQSFESLLNAPSAPAPQAPPGGSDKGAAENPDGADQ